MYFYLLLQIWVKMLVKNISKILNSKCSQNHLSHAKQYATDLFNTSSKRVVQKQWRQPVV